MTHPEVIGEYVVVRRLAAGGMGEVFLARREGPMGFRRPVAIKRILPQYMGNETVLNMFLSEACLAAQLRHPNIVHVYELGQDGGTFFLAMEYLEGLDWARLITSHAPRGLPVDLALRITCDVASALHYAHELTDDHGGPLDIIHRDVSPHNVFLAREGVAKVLDFGIAKARDSITTAEGVLKGKLRYMSPEQFRRQNLDRRADVFSLALCLHEALVSDSASFGEQQVTEFLEGRMALPLVSDGRGDVTLEIDEVIGRATARDLDERYPTAAAFREALLAYASSADVDVQAVDLAYHVERVEDAIAREPMVLGTRSRHTRIDRRRGFNPWSGSGSNESVALSLTRAAPPDVAKQASSSGWALIVWAVGLVLAVGALGAMVTQTAAPPQWRVSSEPQGASVVVNGEVVGRTPATLSGELFGPHYSVELRAPGYVTQAWQGSTASVPPYAVWHAELEPVPAETTSTEAVRAAERAPVASTGTGRASAGERRSKEELSRERYRELLAGRNRLRGLLLSDGVGDAQRKRVLEALEQVDRALGRSDLDAAEQHLRDLAARTGH